MNAVFNVLCDSTVKGAMVLAAAYLATSLLYRRSAALRHAMWAAALACLLVIPLVSVLSPPVQFPILPAHSSDTTSIEIAPQINTTDTIDVPKPSQQRPSAPGDRPDIASQHPIEAVHSPSAFTASASVPRAAAVPVVPMTSKKNSLSWKDWAATMWLAIAAIILARLCLGQILLALRARHATIITDGVLCRLLAGVCERIGLHRPVRLVGGSEPMPMTWGIWRPVILLPADAEQWTPEKQLIVLLHEAGHIKRLDCLWQMIGQVAAAIFWINPLTWLGVMKLRAEAERACDDLVLSTGQRPSAYAEQLLDIVRAARDRHRGLANIGALAMARPSQLQNRVRAILDLRHRRTQITRRFAAIASVIALILVVPLAVIRLSVRSIAQTAPTQALNATTKPTAEVLSVVAELSSDSFAVRQAATEKLVEMGMDIEPQLQELLKGSSLTEEARLRIIEVIQRIYTAPSIITLHYTDAPMMAVLEDFAHQSRADLGIHRPKIADYAKSRRLSINVDHVSFWAALQKIEQASDLRMNGMGALAGERLTLQLDNNPYHLDDPNMLGGSAKVAGPFLIVPTESHQNHDMNYQNDRAGQPTMGMEFAILTEPKLSVLSTLPKDWLKDATDDNGNELLEPITYVSQTFNWRQQQEIGLNVPANLGKKISRLRGNIHLTLGTRSEIVEINDLSQFQPITHDFMGKSVTLNKIARTEQGWQVTFISDALIDNPRRGNTLERGMEWDPSFLLNEQLASSVEMLDPAGHIMFEMGGFTTVAMGIGGGQATINYRPIDEKTPVPDLKTLRWDIPVETRTLDVPFELNDLDLPVGQ